MDLGNGRSEWVDLPPDAPVVFTAPYSDNEFLFLPGSPSVGVVYQPMKMDEPIPWRSDCLHCIQAKQGDLDVALKRSLQVLISRRVHGGIESYQVPTNDLPCSVLCRFEEKRVILKLIRDRKILDAVWEREELISESKDLLLNSKILKRSLKLIGSKRSVSMRSLKACLMPLLMRQKKDGIATHNRHLCLKIDWANILLSL